MTSSLGPTRTGALEAGTLPGRYFTSPQIFAGELERIFYQRWLCVGRADQIPHPGDYVLQQIGHESIILVRDQAGNPRAFYNVCRHRGSLLCQAERGRLSETIQCPYHAWTYSLDGRLIGSPHMNEVPEFDRANYALRAVEIESWEGFLFINLTPAESFAQAFAPLVDRFRHWSLVQLSAARRIEYGIRANWKLLFQNYSECLHCPPLHPALAKLSPYLSGANDLYEGPFLGGFMTLVQPGGSLSMSGSACGVVIGDLPDEDRQRVYYYTIFPNLFLSLHPDYVMVHTLWPQAPDRTRVVCEWLFHPDSFTRPGFNPDDAVEFWDMTNQQDWHICELSQQGVTSRAYTPGPLSPRESLLAAFDREYLRAIGD